MVITILYTSTPLERIYYNHNEKDIKTKDKAEYKEIQLKSGSLVAKRMGDKYVVDYINSTDMLDYLNINYIPGSFL